MLDREPVFVKRLFELLFYGLTPRPAVLHGLPMARKRNDDLALAIGQRVKAMRKAAGLTQEQLAEAVALQPSAVSRFENGAIGLSLTTLLEVARVLRVPLARLFEDGEAGQASPSDAEEAMLLQAWRSLTAPYRVHVMAIVRWAQEATAFAEAQAVYERVRGAGVPVAHRASSEASTMVSSAPSRGRRR